MTLEISISVNEMEQIKEKIFEKMGLDLSYYKSTFLERRINVRMKLLNVSSGSEYAELLNYEPDEITSLYDSLSINVTKFYRDKYVWKIFESKVIPKLLELIKPSDTLRIWSSGCASGEEPYSLAIMFSEALQRTNCKFRILANDINTKAIQKAQKGIYPHEILKNLEPHLISKYFEKLRNDQFQINQKIKDLVTFNVGDLITFPTSYLDVVFCRNLLIYYTKDAQDLIFKKFFKVLKQGRFLVLGMDESLLSNPVARSFTPIYPREKIYHKTRS